MIQATGNGGETIDTTGPVVVPGANGTFAKFLRSYVRECQLMSMQEALRKMCLMPAQILEWFVPQVKRKGSLQNNAGKRKIHNDRQVYKDRHAPMDA